ncbi:BON domain-containing protein [Legionella geestiana]|nr:BON domain-containing protein [Legionella geestiana]
MMMKAKGLMFFAQGCAALLLSGCIGAVWTGANMVYDRHSVYRQVDDLQLGAEVNHALFHDRLFRQPGCSIDAAVFNGDVLLAGHVPTEALRKEAARRIESTTGYRRFFNQLSLHWKPWYPLQDGLITANIRTRIFSDARVNPRTFKVVTSDSIVYLMGDVDREEAALVIDMARHTEGVSRVVTLFRYYTLTEKPKV